MNLIDQLGGYEKAKEELKNTSSDQWGYKFSLQMDLLKYRRENSIYEVGDKYVMLKIQHEDLITILEGDLDEPWFNTRIIRHATDEEIKAGRRL